MRSDKAQNASSSRARASARCRGYSSGRRAARRDPSSSRARAGDLAPRAAAREIHGGSPEEPPETGYARRPRDREANTGRKPRSPQPLELAVEISPPRPLANPASARSLWRRATAQLKLAFACYSRPRAGLPPSGATRPSGILSGHRVHSGFSRLLGFLVRIRFGERSERLAIGVKELVRGSDLLARVHCLEHQRIHRSLA